MIDPRSDTVTRPTGARLWNVSIASGAPLAARRENL